MTIGLGQLSSKSSTEMMPQICATYSQSRMCIYIYMYVSYISTEGAHRFPCKRNNMIQYNLHKKGFYIASEEKERAHSVFHTSVVDTWASVS